MTEPRAALDDPAFMDAFLDLIIPPGPSGTPPGAGTLGLSAAVAAGLRADPLLGPLVEPGVEAVREAAVAQQPDGGLAGMTSEAGTRLLEAQISAHPVLMMGILRYLYPVYYQHPQVMAGIGEAARPPFPEGFEVEATDPGLLDKLRARRKSPGAG
jgi:hypothetical protein